MKKGKKLFVGLALLLSLGAVSLSSCSLFSEEGYQIIGIETIHDEVGGYTVVRITTNSEDEENKVMGIQFEPIVQIDENSENIFQEFFNLLKQSGGNKNA